MRRLPIRLRLAIAFAVAMSALLTAVGCFRYVRLGADLARATDQELRQRAQDVGSLVRAPHSTLDLGGLGLVERGESFAQVLAADGTVLEHTRPLESRPLLGQTERALALDGTLFTNRPSVPGLDEPARLLATPLTRGRQPVVLVVGVTRQNRRETLASLRTELFIGGPLTLLAAALGGYLLAGAALRPVEAMRRRAAAITATEPGQRLPLPAARDELARLGATLNAMLSRLEAALDRDAPSSPTLVTSCAPRLRC